MAIATGRSNLPPATAPPHRARNPSRFREGRRNATTAIPGLTRCWFQSPLALAIILRDLPCAAHRVSSAVAVGPIFETLSLGYLM